MSAKPQLLAVVDETPRAIASGACVELQTIEAYNSNATGAWVKIYAKATAPVNGDTPLWQRFVAQGAVTLPAFFAGAQMWIAATTTATITTLDAPPADLIVALTYAPQ